MGNSPSKRVEVRSHSNVLMGSNVYVWGGLTATLPFTHDSQSKRSELSSLTIYSLKDGKCTTRSTSGHFPNAAVFYRCCSVKDRIYYFGGRCKSNDCFHNSLYVLETNQFHWTAIDCNRGPMEKTACGMVAFKIAGEDHIMVIAGRGPAVYPNRAQLQPCATYRITHDDRSRCYTNEIHIMNITTHEGQWRTVPDILGDVFPPSAFFTMNILSDNKAIIFGGIYLDEEGKYHHSDNVFILTYGRNFVEFKHLTQPEHSRWPRARDGHASVVIECVTANQTKKQYLAVLGGLCEGDNDQRPLHVLSDFWVMDIEEKSWKKIYDNFDEIGVESICKRYDHFITSLRMSCNCYWLLITGGRITRADLIKGSNAVVLVELVYSIREDSWNVCNVIKRDKLRKTSQFLDLVFQRLIEVREENEEALHHINKIEQQKNTQIKNLRDQLHEQFELHMTKDQAFDNKRTEFLNAQATFNRTIIEDREEIQGLQRIRDQAREECERLSRTLQQMEQELEEKEDRIQRLRDQLENRSWIVQERDIVRGREIARGAYGVVSVAQFRGIEVAAKSIHDVIISEYNISKFKEEMEMSSKMHHPNIVQFIGATCSTTGEKLTILYELMPKSLYKKLNMQPKSHFKYEEILDISVDVCSALVYLHMWTPTPIIHRDLSSPNVLIERLGGGKWRSKLSDFGSARFQFCISGKFPGTPVYAAPEAENPNNHSPQMDVYSLGVLITELFLHLPPENSHVKRVEKAMTLQPEVRELVLECLHQDVRNRITSPQLLEELKSLKDEDSVV